MDHDEPTPRTDAAQFRLSKSVPHGRMVVSAHFAQQLERELAAKEKERAAASEPVAIPTPRADAEIYAAPDGPVHPRAYDRLAALARQLERELTTTQTKLRGCEHYVASAGEVGVVPEEPQEEASSPMHLWDEFLKWNRSKADPPVQIGREYSVARALSHMLTKEESKVAPSAHEFRFDADGAAWLVLRPYNTMINLAAIGAGYEGSSIIGQQIKLWIEDQRLALGKDKP